MAYDAAQLLEMTAQQLDDLFKASPAGDIPDGAAAQLCCGLVQTPEGVLALTHCMLDLIERANARGDVRKARLAESVCARFMRDHPLPH